MFNLTCVNFVSAPNMSYPYTTPVLVKSNVIFTNKRSQAKVSTVYLSYW